MQFLNFDFRKKDIDINIKIKAVNCLIMSVEMKIKKRENKTNDWPKFFITNIKNFTIKKDAEYRNKRVKQIKKNYVIRNIIR